MKVLISAALQAEIQPIIDHYALTQTAPDMFSGGDLSVLVTGVGLLRVATRLSPHMDEYDFFLNIGSCGCINGKYGRFELVEPRGFMQGDFPGFELNTDTPANRLDPCYLGLTGLTPTLCSVNRFVTEPIPGAELVDMEGYAFAAMMITYSRPFRVLKAVSDSGDRDEFHSSVSACIEANMPAITAAIDEALQGRLRGLPY
ncbi:MAG: hypothetical protein IK083_04045 [Abditibacteriota bacterium]|nr:hypothetical protein [Abditibacteriota bacterium]